MARALELAATAALAGEVPVGALVTGPDGRVLAEAHNLTRTLSDPTGHAEILALRAAGAALGSPRLSGCALYVTLEPCPMCAAAIAEARIERLVYAASDPKGGGVDHGPRIFAQPGCRHAPEVVSGISEAQAARLLQDFFAARR
jgi:tRNA(Arg) A34 adenosine deaminase TadA